MDGLVTNVSLIAGVGGGGGSQHAIVLTGLAGLAAGAFSMAAGRVQVSVSSQSELGPVRGGQGAARAHHQRRRRAARAGRDAAPARHQRGHRPAAAAEISAHPDKALAVHTLEELGVNSAELPSPLVAAGASLVTFAVGAIIPLFPYLLGFDALWVALLLSAVAAIVGGGLVARLTARPFWRGALRQLALGAIAAGFTYLIGLAVGRMASKLTPVPRSLPTGKATPKIEIHQNANEHARTNAQDK